MLVFAFWIGLEPKFFGIETSANDNQADCFKNMNMNEIMRSTIWLKLFYVDYDADFSFSESTGGLILVFVPNFWSEESSEKTRLLPLNYLK